MLNKTLCLQAIKNWKDIHSDYSKIKSHLFSDGKFIFNKETCNWLIDKNKANNFHAYLGVKDESLIIICVPLNQEKSEISLSEYPFVTYAKITEKIHLTEVITTQTKNRITLLPDMSIERDSYVTNSPLLEGSHVTTRVGLTDIVTWRKYGKDWLYKEASNQGIPLSFSVPINDLKINNGEGYEKKALFILKTSELFQLFLSLLFIEGVTNEGNAFPLLNEDAATVQTNTDNFAQPCPPFCKNKTSFKLLS